LLGVTFGRVLCGSASLFYRDFGAFSYPVACFHRESFWRAELPLWNHLSHCGIPFLAQWNTHTLYPLALIYLLLPIPWSFNLFCILHLALGGTGMYRLARRAVGGSLAAGVAGLVYALNGLSRGELCQGADTCALGWAPWVVLVADLGLEKGGRWLLLWSLVGSLQMLAGRPEIIVFTWCLVGVMSLPRYLRSDARARVSMVRRLAGVVVLITLVCAAQLLPFSDLLMHSERSDRFGNGSQWTIPASGLANYLVPLYHLARDSNGVPSFYDQQWISSYYVGVGTVGLAVLSAAFAPRLRELALLGIAGFGALMAMGDAGYLYPFVKFLVPQVGLMRFPVKFVVLPTLALPLLAAAGFSSIDRLSRDQWEARSGRILLTGAGLLACIAFIVWSAMERPRILDDVAATARNARARVFFLVATFGWLWFLRNAKSAATRAFLGACYLSLFWLDLVTHQRDIAPAVRTSACRPDAVANARRWDPEFRVEPVWSYLTTPQDGAALPARAGDRTAAFLLFRSTLYANFNLLDHVPSVGGLYALHVREFEEIRALLWSGEQAAPGLRDFLGISHVGLSHPLGWEDRKKPLPLLTCGQQPAFAADSTALEAIGGDPFRPDQIVYLPVEARGFITAGRSPQAHIESSHVTGAGLTASVSAPRAVMLVAAQTYYHAWHAYVDGRRVPLWRANYAFQALEVPAGRHLVRLSYEDDMFRAGAAFSLASLSICVVGCAWRRRGPHVLPSGS
jgi:hypothetical protein